MKIRLSVQSGGFARLHVIQESNSSKKIESEVKCNLPEDYYSF